MRIWLRAFGLFALMVATPFVIERLMGRHTRFPGDDFPWANLFAYGAVSIAVLGGIIGFAVLYNQADDISRCLSLAERELNILLRSGVDHGGRKNTAKERSEWRTMITKDDSTKPEELVDLNEKDLQGKGAAMGKASMTAFLLRLFYEGDVEIARSKIYAEKKINDKIPFVAPGLRELLDIEKFDDTKFEANKGFPPGSGVAWLPLVMAVKLGRHPSGIIMVKTDAEGNKTKLENWDVIEELTRQKA